MLLRRVLAFMRSGLEEMPTWSCCVSWQGDMVAGQPLRSDAGAVLLADCCATLDAITKDEVLVERNGFNIVFEPTIDDQSPGVVKTVE